MASAMRKMAVYLGLVEDDHRYDDPYSTEYSDNDDYSDYVTEYAETADPQDGAVPYADSAPDRAQDGAPDGTRALGSGHRPRQDHDTASAHLQ